MSSLPSTQSNWTCRSSHWRTMHWRKMEDKTSSINSQPAKATCPELAGLKVRTSGATAIYLIDGNGYRRLIPFPSTFINLFNDSALDEALLKTDMVADIAEGPALDDGAVLIRAVSSESLYLMDKGKKRPIAGQRVMDKYGFCEAYVVSVPQIVIDAIPTGDAWE
jgi:hypothetical protein